MKKNDYKDCPCNKCIEKPCQFWNSNPRCTEYRRWEKKKK